MAGYYTNKQLRELAARIYRQEFNDEDAAKWAETAPEAPGILAEDGCPICVRIRRKAREAKR